MNHLSTLSALSLVLFAQSAFGQDLFRIPDIGKPRWYSFENRTGGKGTAGSTNKGAKGDAWEPIPAGKSQELMNVDGPGVLRRMWLTLRPWNQKMLRSLVLEIYWDHSTKPAVEVPVGDFFGNGLAQPVAGESAFFSNPEGRSYNCYIPMPFRTGARVVLRNENTEDVGLFFYDIDITKGDHIPSDAGYFHAFWHRDPHTALGKDYDILPPIKGRGRYLGATIGVQGHPQYGESGWGEGEVKVYLDGDTNLPTICGTGTEDYIGTGWGMGPFFNQYQGCSLSDNKLHCWAFYRLHIPDPIIFDHDCHVTIQDIGGDATEAVRKMVAAGAELVPVSSAADNPGFGRLLSDPNYPKLSDPKFPLDSWVNFFRRDDYSSVAYFYLDKPTTELPRLQPVAERTEHLRY
ncbi:MAG TPA: DUF2961 domain-containing protein [Fimbriimonadaceae bacterium]|jgi:hypothetical protein